MQPQQVLQDMNINLKQFFFFTIQVTVVDKKIRHEWTYLEDLQQTHLANGANSQIL